MEKTSKIGERSGQAPVSVKVLDYFNKNQVEVQNGSETCLAAIPVPAANLSDPSKDVWKITQFSSLNAMNEAIKKHGKKNVMKIRKYDNVSGYQYMMYIPSTQRPCANMDLKIRNGRGKNADNVYCEIAFHNA